jgi:hypothetical protein
MPQRVGDAQDVGLTLSQMAGKAMARSVAALALPPYQRVLGNLLPHINKPPLSGRRHLTPFKYNRRRIKR